MRKALYVFHLILRDTKEGLSMLKNGCALLEGIHPSVLQHTLCTVDTPRSPRSLAPPPLKPLSRGNAAPQSPRQGVTYETLHPRIPHVPDHSARLAKLPLLCSHYPFNFSLHGVGFLLLTLIQVQSIITPRGIG